MKMKLIVIILIMIFFIQLYWAERIVDSSIDLTSVEDEDYKEKNWLKSLVFFKSIFWKLQFDQMVQLLYTTLTLFVIEAGTFSYKKHILNQGTYSPTHMIEINICVAIVVLIVMICNNLVIKKYKQDTIRIQELGYTAKHYTQKVPLREDDVIEIRDIIVESPLQLMAYHIINFPLWRQLHLADRIQLSENYIIYIFQGYPKLGKKLINVRLRFSSTLQVVSNMIILLSAVRVIIV